MMVRMITTIGASLSLGVGCQQLETPTHAPVTEEVSSMESGGATAQPHGPARFDLGRSPDSDEIAAWDLDVMPNGEGLPPGSGTVQAGRSLYVDQCQRCHGVGGRGGPFDELVGRLPDESFPFALDPTVPRTIGSYWPFATTLFDYTRRAMPQDRPGSLGDADVYSLTAYLLHLNGLVEADASIDRESLPTIVMPARDRFVPDDRGGGEEIR
jgi:cytochrome c